MDIILKLKHWQIFLIFCLGSLTSNFTLENEEFVTAVINAFGLIIYFFWYFSVGLELTEYLPPRIELPKTLFIINAFLLLLSFSVILILFDGSFTGTGLLSFLWIGYLTFAMFQFMLFPSKTLKTIEPGQEATFGQYVGYFFLMIFWPIGIWFIQPKINKIIKAADNNGEHAGPL